MQLGEAHQAQIATFVQFYRGETARFCADKDKGLLEYIGDRLPDDQAIYNTDTVKMVLNEYHQILMQPVREEGERTSNRSSVYISQLMYQAEQAGFSLAAADIQACDNPQMAAQVIAMAQQGARGALPAARPGLAPIGGTTGADPATLQALQDAQEQNRQKDDRITTLQMEMTGLLKERSTMSGELEKMRENIRGMRSRMQDDPQAAQLDRQMQETKAQLDSKDAECDRMRQDLQRRLGDSAQFRDLKSMMKKKSDEVKELKRMLIQHGIQPPGSMSGGVELDADSD